ncbi:hypothetical protein [Variovorax sp. EBFNA2]|uniref:hypothetical protein n=1 Tax=Variovorax sp. EBFNA2 TaxID=3342097 RepID=UPI0029BFFDE4|nr:hypothetical protein [Variovorax boronicumulans]WPG41619.1 hypothetical protein RZE79_32475 [Variovorax boronicumulans]
MTATVPSRLMFRHVSGQADWLTPGCTAGYIPQRTLGEATLPRHTYVILAFIAIAVLAGNVMATVVVWRSDFYSPLQRKLQLALVWLIPVIGAACCISFASLHKRPIPKPEKRFPGPDSFQLPGGEANGP